MLLDENLSNALLLSIILVKSFTMHNNVKFENRSCIVVEYS